MAYEIVWTEIAKEDFKILVDNLLHFAKVETAEQFVDTTYRRLESLERFPNSGRRSEKITFVRRILINANIALYYRVMGNQLVLLNFIDLRTNPSLNPYQ